MDYEKLIRELVDKKAEQDNQIDLHAYENGMRALAEALSIANVVGQSEQLVCDDCESKNVRDTDYGKQCGNCFKYL